MKVINKLKAIIIVLSVFLIIGILGYYEHTYTVSATVYKLSGKYVYFRDSRGEVWEYCDTSNTYNKNQTVKLTLWDNYTDSKITDDEIREVRVK